MFSHLLLATVRVASTCSRASFERLPEISQLCGVTRRAGSLREPCHASLYALTHLATNRQTTALSVEAVRLQIAAKTAELGEIILYLRRPSVLDSPPFETP
jgi:hypothetical protein